MDMHLHRQWATTLFGHISKPFSNVQYHSLSYLVANFVRRKRKCWKTHRWVSLFLTKPLNTYLDLRLLNQLTNAFFFTGSTSRKRLMNVLSTNISSSHWLWRKKQCIAITISLFCPPLLRHFNSTLHTLHQLHHPLEHNYHVSSLRDILYHDGHSLVIRHCRFSLYHHHHILLYPQW